MRKVPEPGVLLGARTATAEVLLDFPAPAEIELLVNECGQMVSDLPAAHGFSS
jgi:hypothetical protein